MDGATDNSTSREGARTWTETARDWRVGRGRGDVRTSLHEALSSLLDRNAWRPGQRVPSHRDLAIEFGVSPVTMYKVLTDLVGEGRLVRRHGVGTFVARSAERSAEQGIRLGIVVPRKEWLLEPDVTFSALMRGVYSSLAPYGLSASHTVMADWSRRSLTTPEWLFARGCCLFVSPQVDRWDEVEEVQAAGVPVCVVLSHRAKSTVCCVHSDNAQGMRLAVDHLVGLGHKRIACGVASVEFVDHRDRIAAYREVMRERGCPVRADYVLERWMPSAETGIADLESLLGKPDRPTALIVLDAVTVTRTLHIADRLGLRVPEDLSLIGFDDDPTTCGPHGITVVAQAVPQIGSSAIQVLIDMLGERLPPLMSTEPMELVVRESTAPPRLEVF